MESDADENRVRIFDTTLRDGEQAAGVNLNVAEKLQIARQLADLGVDVIEAGFPIASPGDFNCVRAVANEVAAVTVAALARTREEDIRAAADALAGARRPRLHVFIATSPIHMTHKLKLTPEQVLAEVKSGVSLAKSLAPEVEFSAEDASRSQPDFLIRAFRTALAAGATVLNIPDTVGYAMPQEFAEFVGRIIAGVAAPKNVIFSVHAHNDLGLATANSLAAVKAGVRQVECTMNGLGERGGNAALEEAAMALRTRRDFHGLSTGLDTRRLTQVSRLVSRLTGVAIPPNKPIVGANAFAHEAGIHQHGVMANRETYEIMRAEDVGAVAAVMVLGKHSGRHAFQARLEELGYRFSQDEVNLAFAGFKRLCDAKKDVTDGDIEALVADEVLGAVPEHRYELKDYSVQIGGGLATASVTLAREGGEIRDAATGNGPVDAAYNAIKRVIGVQPSLESFKINAASHLSDSVGEAQIVIRLGDVRAAGRGASTDVIEASVKAYVNAVNSLYVLTAAKEALNHAGQ